jgi:DNA-binding MarR family transcriptional regulator
VSPAIIQGSWRTSDTILLPELCEREALLAAVGLDMARSRSAPTNVGDRDVTIALTNAQVAQIVRESPAESARASVLLTQTGVSTQLTDLGDFDELRRRFQPLLNDETLSRSTLRALLVLAVIPANGPERELTEIARDVGLPLSTTHRYVATWRALGLLERQPRSRRYRRVITDDIES